MKHFKSLILVIAIFSFSHSKAEILRQGPAKQYKAAFEADLAKANEACGTHIVASYDHSKETGHAKANVDSGNGFNICATAPRALRTICSDIPESKEVVATKIKKIQCSFELGSNETTRKRLALKPGDEFMNIALKSGTLSWVFEWSASTNADHTFLYGWLKKTL